MNSWSNVAYLIAGIYLLSRASKTTSDKALGFCAIIVAICSFVGHASVTVFLGSFDYASIYLTFAYLIAVNLERIRVITRSRRMRAWGVIFVSASLVVALFYSIRLFVFAGLTVAYLGTELYLFPTLNAPSRRGLILMASTFLVGVVLMVLDAQDIVCYPRNHWMQLHAFWHVLSAIAVVLAANYLKCVSADTART